MQGEKIIDIKVPIIKIVDQILLDLWYSNEYKLESQMAKNISCAKSVYKEESEKFLNQAQGLANFIDHKIIQSNRNCRYKELRVGDIVRDLLEERQDKFQHPSN